MEEAEAHREMNAKTQRANANMSEEARLLRLKEGYRIVEDLRKQAQTRGIEDVSMEEIDAIIAECRQQMRQEQNTVYAVNEG